MGRGTIYKCRAYANQKFFATKHTKITKKGDEIGLIVLISLPNFVRGKMIAKPSFLALLLRNLDVYISLMCHPDTK